VTVLCKDVAESLAAHRDCNEIRDENLCSDLGNQYCERSCGFCEPPGCGCRITRQMGTHTICVNANTMSSATMDTGYCVGQSKSVCQSRPEFCVYADIVDTEYAL